MNYTRLIAAVLVLGLLAVAAMAADKKSGTSEAKPADATPVTAADLRELRETLAAQQQQIKAQQEELQQLREELARKDEKPQQAGSGGGSVQNGGADSDAVAGLKSDVADIQTTLTNNAVNTQDEQKRTSAVEGILGRFRLSGDARVRYENFFQSYSGCVAPNCNPRNRERLRLRIGLDGKLSEDFVGGFYIATGDLSEPISTNQTMTGFFNRKPIGVDRGWITYQPTSHRWLQLTGGKFAYTWMRTNLTFDPDLNPEGFSQKLSFDFASPTFKNVTFTGMQMMFNESSKGTDSFAAGGQISSRLKLGGVTITPAFTALNWRNVNPIAAAVSGGTLLGNALTNATSPDKKSYLSRFLYLDTMVDIGMRTPWARFPARLVLDYVDNPNAISNRNKGYWAEFALGRTQEKGDVQFGYTFARVEQDAVIAAFNESDLRAGTNVVQNRIIFNYQAARNTTLAYTLWLGRTLDRNAQNAAVVSGLPPGLRDPFLTRIQLDIVYKF